METPLIILTFLVITINIIFILSFSHRQKMAMIERGIDMPKALGKTRNKIHQVLFVVGLFSVAIAIGIFIGTLYSIYIDSIKPEWDYSSGRLPMKYNDEVGYQVSLFLFCGLSLVYSFFKIRKWNREDIDN